ANAVAQGAPANFSLITLPDNCWGMNMNYGLIKLGQASDITITVTADGSSMAPIFALYQGWDTSTGASRHGAIFFGDNNPLGTEGLTYLGDIQNPEGATTISKTFTGLAAGNYELFTTVANNNNPGGAFKVTVKTTPINYTLTVNKPINGTVKSPALNIDCGTAGDKCQATVPDGGNVTLSAIPDKGIPFLGWAEPPSCAGTGDCSFTMKANTEVSALFVEVPPGHAALLVSNSGHGRVDSSPAGIECGDGCTSAYAFYPLDTPVTLKSTANGGYSFAGWSDDCTGTGDCILTLDANKSVRAVFLQNHTLTVEKPVNGVIKSPALGIDCGTSADNCQVSLPPGASVILSATPNSGFSFLGWTQPASCAGTGDCSFTLNGDTLVSGSFAQIPVGQAALTIGKEGQGRITSTPPGIDCGDGCTSSITHYPIGTSLTLKATPNAGYNFKGWSGACAGTGECALTLDTNQSVGAIFSLPADGNGQCGAANNRPYSTAPTSAAELCAVGEPGSVTVMKHSRFNWLCTGGSLAERCYTLGNNNKQNQAPLILSPGSQKVTVGQRKLIQNASGGSGNGRIQYNKSVSQGTKCRLLPLGKKVRVFVRGEPGVCKITATKVRSRKYNEVQSAPVTLTVTR
ncbi:hypothetical protein FJY94_08290, partial [Candidatus Kaiserbacteria bacterium]|nr:hypothetical protein [Candidatus Kaiserbacteria bacterium]